MRNTLLNSSGIWRKYLFPVPRTFVVLFAFLLMTTNNFYGQEPSPLSAIVVSPSQVERIIGRTAQFTYTLMPADAMPSSVTWSCSDPSVVSIDNSGTATAIRPGMVTITARTDNGCEATALFTVPEHPTAISLPEEWTMTTRRPAKLEYVLAPAEAQTIVTWMNSAPDIVSVAADGTLKARAKGTAIITAQTSNGLRDKCIVTIEQPHLKFYVWHKNGAVVGYEFDEKPNVTINTDAFVLTTIDTRIVYAPGDIVRFTLEDDSFINPTASGDVNGDGVVDLTDAIMIVYYSLGQELTDFNEVVADVNEDGTIDLTDAIIVVYKSLGVE